MIWDPLHRSHNLSLQFTRWEIPMTDTLFLRHPRSVGESYREHQSVALTFAGELVAAGLADGVHAIVPALFTKTASRAIERLHACLVLHRSSATGKPASAGRMTA